MKKKSIKSKNELDKIDIENIKEFNNKIFNNNNNNKIAKNNIKTILGNNHRQILGINNNNENNIFLIGKNPEMNNEFESNISPKNIKGEKKIINLTNNNNGKKFKILENTNLRNYNSNDNMLNNKKRSLNNRGVFGRVRPGEEIRQARNRMFGSAPFLRGDRDPCAKLNKKLFISSRNFFAQV